MFISIVIPCFNGASTLAEAILSALAQGDVECDIVIVDDGSADDSLLIARRFEPAVRVLTGPNRGVSAARNRGIAETSGEWIVFLDADDLLLPGTLRKRLDVARSTGPDVVTCDWQEFIDYGTGMEYGPVKSADVMALGADAEVACATHWKPAVGGLMYRRTLFEKIGGFREDLAVVEDARFLFDAAYHGARFAHASHVGAQIRVLPHSLSRRDPALFWRCCLLNGKQIEALWRARGALSPRQLAALADIFNGAAHGLFRAGDPSFHQALAALRASHLPIGRRNRLAELVTDAAGHGTALRMAGFWTKSRRAVASVRRSFGGAPWVRQTQRPP